MLQSPGVTEVKNGAPAFLGRRLAKQVLRNKLGKNREAPQEQSPAPAVRGVQVPAQPRASEASGPHLLPSRHTARFHSPVSHSGTQFCGPLTNCTLLHIYF